MADNLVHLWGGAGGEGGGLGIRGAQRDGAAGGGGGEGGDLLGDRARDTSPSPSVSLRSASWTASRDSSSGR